MCVTAAFVCFLALLFFARRGGKKEKKQRVRPDWLLDMKTFSFLGLKSWGGKGIKAGRREQKNM